MKKDLRHIIREQLSDIFEAMGGGAMDGGVLDDAMGDIQAQITTNIANLTNIKKASDQRIKDQQSDIKAKKQLKGQLPAQNSERQGLEREIPTKEKEIEKQKKQAEDLEKAKTDFEKAQAELQKQQLALAQAKPEGEKTTEPTLKSLPSAI